MTPMLRHRGTRVYLALVVATSHFMLMVLGLGNRLAYSIPSRYDILQQTIGSSFWTFLHGVCFLAIVFSISVKKGEVSALGAATGVMSAWAFLSFLWGLSTPSPVSLAGPILGGGIATLSYILTIAWARAYEVSERPK